MTVAEKIIVSAYTGYLMCDFYLVHKYVEKVMGRPVWTREFACDEFNEELRQKVKPDFIKICKNENICLHLQTDGKTGGKDEL